MSSVPGLNGTHSWGGVVLNDLTSWPRVRLEKIPGLRTLGDLEDARDTPAGRSGEVPRRYMDRGKQVVYSGTVEAHTQSELEDLCSTLLAAFSARDGRMTMVAPTTDSFFYDARVTALDIPEEFPDDSTLRFETRGHQRSFTLGLRLPDPAFYRAAAITAQTAAVTATAGTPLPWRLPVAITAPGTASGTVVLTNRTMVPTNRGYIDLYGPSSRPAVHNETLGKQVALLTDIAAGDFVRLDFYTRTLLRNGVEEINAQLDRDLSTWWEGNTPGLAPGANTIRYSAINLADPAHAVATFNEAQLG